MGELCEDAHSMNEEGPDLIYLHRAEVGKLVSVNGTEKRREYERTLSSL
jgi:hypothetical protein